jgi:hypothetical protein
VEEPIGRVKRPFSVATGCSARLLRHFRPGTDARVAARRQAGGGDAEWGGRLAEMIEEVAHRVGVGDEGDDTHRAATGRTHQRKNFVDAGAQ